MFRVKTRDQIATYAYGHDFGNSETCGAVLKGKGNPQKVMIPSVWAPGSWGEVESLAGSMGQDVRSYMQSNHYHLRYVGKGGEMLDEYVGKRYSTIVCLCPRRWGTWNATGEIIGVWQP